MKKLFIICFLSSASVVVFAKTFETKFIPTHSKKGIDTTQIVLVGGIKQYIKINYQTHFTLAEEYYNSLVATKKRQFWFEKSGHLIPNSEPALVQNIIIKQVLPETFSVL